jgi:hypothetical protein
MPLASPRDFNAKYAHGGRPAGGAAGAVRAAAAPPLTAYVGGGDTITPIDTATNTAGPPITVVGAPMAIAIMPAPAAPGPAGPIVSGYRPQNASPTAMTRPRTTPRS